MQYVIFQTNKNNKLHGLSPQANYTDCLSAKLVSTFADKGCHVVRVMDHYGRILGFLDWSRYLFFQVAPQLYSRG
jgi:CBS-domain-containing membrane protein